MSKRWKLCEKTKPDSEREILLALPCEFDVIAGRWLTPENQWVRTGTNEICYPTFWREMPENPMIGSD